MEDNRRSELQKLRDRVFNDLTGLADQIAVGDSDIDLESLMTVIRATGNTKLIGKAAQKIESMGDSKEKLDAVLDLANEIDFQISELEPAKEQPSESQSATTSDENKAINIPQI
jgi:hypothetical protein